MEYERTYFQGKGVVITGAASGIGLALCEELLICGVAFITLIDYDAQNLNVQIQRLTKMYPDKVKGIHCDVTQESAVQNAITQSIAFCGQLDLLINCAGAGFSSKFTVEPEGLNPDNPFMAKVADNASWKSAFDLNFYGALYGCRAALPPMITQGQGQIVNIISGIAFSPMAYQSQYAATKAALCALTLSLRSEYQAEGIRFNAATPGTTATSIFQGAENIPDGAQMPWQSAQRILRGIARNDRLILGDDGDIDGAKQCFMPGAMGKVLDQVFLQYARKRRRGILTFLLDPLEDNPEINVAEFEQLQEIRNEDDAHRIIEKTQAYINSKQVSQMNLADYAGKHTLITGGASGIGLILAEELLSDGAIVVLADNNSKNLTCEVKRLSALYPNTVSGIFCDITVEAQVYAMVAEAQERMNGMLDLLINAVDVGQLHFFADTPRARAIRKKHPGMEVLDNTDWERILSINFYGTLYCCRAALPIMTAQKTGQIINMISNSAFWNLPFQSSDSATEAALLLFTLALRYEYWETGVKISAATSEIMETSIYDGKISNTGESPAGTAKAVLDGALKNERIIYGNGSETLRAIVAYHPITASFIDEQLTHIAEMRCYHDLLYL